MRFISSLAAFALALLPLTSMLGGEFKLEPGFTLIFNGKNLDGWREKGSKDTLDGKTEAHKGRMKLEGGSLHYVYTDKIKGDKYIETTKDYAKDVHLKFDFKAGPACNNDILFRGIKFDIVPGKGETKDVKEGEWYTYELIATGDKIEHKINGKVARAAKDAKAKASTIVLRAEFGVIEIKNIRVKE
jgi:3-keto-disaccharide hydrolase